MSDYLDVFSASTFREISDTGRESGERQWCVDAERVETALRFVTGVFADRVRSDSPPRLQRKFLHWLIRGGQNKIRLSPAARINIRSVLERDSGGPVRELYLHRPDLQSEFPFALLPIGQKRFVQWLQSYRHAKADLTDEQIIWFLYQTATNVPIGLRDTFLLRPEWQRRFPGALIDRRQQKQFLRWLRRQFPEWPALHRVRKVASRPLPRPQPFATGFRWTWRRLQWPWTGGVNLLAHFCYPSGLQRAALTARTALEQAGVQTSCRDVPAGVNTRLEDRESWLGLETYPVTLIMVAPIPHFTNVYARAGLARKQGIYRIATWYWELDTIPEEWARFAESVDEMWAPTPFIAESMAKRLTIPIYNMLPGVSLEPVKHVPRSRVGVPDDHYLFFFMFDMSSQFERKNPMAVIRAFRRAFSREDKVALVIKVTRGERNPGSLALLREAAHSAGVIIVDELISRAEALGYIEMCNCFISLHRSEGFGLCLAEAMLLGKPVIATGYSGNLSFMTGENSWLVDYELIEISGDGRIYTRGNRWAEPSEEHAARLMRKVVANRDEAIERAKRAQVVLREKLSIRAAGEGMVRRLRQVGVTKQRNNT